MLRDRLEEFRGLILSLDEGDWNLLGVVQTGDAFVIRGRQHVLVVVLFFVWCRDLHHRLLLVVHVTAHFSQLHLL